MKDLRIAPDDVKRIYRLLEELNELMHQPLSYRDPAVVEAFAKRNYPEIKDLYYNVVWNWLPPEMRREIEEN